MRTWTEYHGVPALESEIFSVSSHQGCRPQAKMENYRNLRSSIDKSVLLPIPSRGAIRGGLEEPGMYGMIKLLRQAQGWTQEELATELGVAPSQISKWETERVGRPFRRLCAQLRKFAANHPRTWLDVLGSSRGVDGLAEFDGLLFLGPENLSTKVLDVREWWVVSDRPAEVTNPQLREDVIAYLKSATPDGAEPRSICYWISESSILQIRRLLVELGQHFTPEELRRQVRVIQRPAASLVVPVAFYDPRSAKPLGFMEHHVGQGSAAGARVQLLPQATTAHLLSVLGTAFTFVSLDGQFSDAGATWNSLQIAQLLER